jgi:DNA-binding HxlR family transcriptional regulator
LVHKATDLQSLGQAGKIFREVGNRGHLYSTHEGEPDACRSGDPAQGRQEKYATMSRRRFNKMNCTVAQALDQIGDWWTLLIVREAVYGLTSFSAFQQNLGIARNILTGRLNHLVRKGILERRQVRRGVARYTYHLTSKGRDLAPLLVALMQWGDKWIVGRGAEPIRILDAGQRKPIRRIEVTSRAGRSLSIEQLRFRPGPGAGSGLLARFEKARKARRE